MSRVSASDFDRQRSRLWARYLTKSKDCDVRFLDRTLLMPTTEPNGVLPERLAPHVFKEIHASGKNPDGNYWQEYNDSGVKLNVYERVCERVPASREWLLKEFLPYLRDDPPPIAESRAHLSDFLASRNLVFLPGRVASAFEHLFPLRYRYLQKRALRHLVEAATPGTVLLWLSFLHQVTWTQKGQYVEGLARSAGIALRKFCDSLADRGFDDATEIGRGIFSPLSGAIYSIKLWGDRTPYSNPVALLQDLPPFPLLIDDTQQMHDACACLHAAGEESYERFLRPLPAQYEARSGSTWIPTNQSIRNAAHVLVSGVLATHAEIAKDYDRSLLCTLPTEFEAISAKGNRHEGDAV